MMDSPNTEKIATPLRRQIRLLRQQVLPFAVWCVALTGVLVLAQRATMRVDAVGIVELREVMVAPLIDGTVHAMSVDWFDEVESGTTVALMDDTVVKAELATAEAELSMLRAQVNANRDRFELEAALNQLDELGLRRRFILNEEQARLDLMDRIRQHEYNKIELERLRIQKERQQRLVEQDITAQAQFDDTRLRYEALQKQIEEDELAIELAKQQVEEATRRREAYEQRTAQVDVPSLLEPLIQNVRVQETRIQQIVERRKLLALRAPLSGKVSHIFHRTGETVLSGDPILSITDSRSERVLAYVDERAARRIRVGDTVEVSSRDRPKRVATAKVFRVNSRIEEFPIRLRRNPFLPQFGLSILVGNVPPGAFLPGEVLDLRIIPSETG